MLNISENSISDKIRIEDFTAHSRLKKRKFRKYPLYTVLILTTLFFLTMFLPWTQNIKTKGQVTTRLPGQRPQAIQSVIAGRLESWFVQEGDFVEKGDTIIFISEIKSEYFDPALLARTSEQVSAKSQSIASYENKISALKNQYSALEESLVLKKRQTQNKIEQARNKIKMDSIDLVALSANFEIAKNQFSRIQELHNKGLKSLTELQEKELKLQSLSAKVNSQRNKLLNQKNEFGNLIIELSAVQNEYNDKLAKSQSEQQSALSKKLESIASTAKLQNQLSNYNERQKFYYLTAPQSGYITKTLKKGIGEIIKEGVDVATIMPAKYDLAVEMYAKPQDLPLLSIGNKVSLRFDGWPAIVISGWPESSTGIFTGKVVAIDQFISENGNYRLLISPMEDEKAWPTNLRVGTGTQAFILLNDVPIWYEVWRQLNGFPPDFYQDNDKKSKDIKRKAPLKSVK